MHALDCKLSLIFAAIVTFVATGCGKSQEAGVYIAPSRINADAAATGRTPEEASLGMEISLTSGGPATWSHLASGNSWTAATMREVSANLSNFERASDKESYCPGYSQASVLQRETCWVRLVSAIAQFESGFDTRNKFREASGAYSVGLLQLSTGECAGAESIAALQDPIRNLQCGTRKLAALIARDGYVTSPDNAHGGAAYWSTLRRPYTSGRHHVGKALEVRLITRKFHEVNPPGAAMETEMAALE
jgi:hypothetical protein